MIPPIIDSLVESRTSSAPLSLRPGRKEEEEEVRLRMVVERLDDSPAVEQNTLTNKIKQKSRKIVMDAEQGEARTAIEKCKNFLSSVQSSNFACKIFINSWEVSSVLAQPSVRSMLVSISGHRGD